MLYDYFDVCPDYGELLEWWHSRRFPLSSCPQLTPLILHGPLVCSYETPIHLHTKRLSMLQRYKQEGIQIVSPIEYGIQQVTFYANVRNIMYTLPFPIHSMDTLLLTSFLGISK